MALLIIGLSALILWGPLAPRFEDGRIPVGVGIAMLGLGSIVIMFVLSRPGGALEQKSQAHEKQLALVVGEPTVFFAGTLTVSTVSKNARSAGKTRGSPWAPLVLCAVGPLGVAAGRGFRQRRIHVLAEPSDVVSFSVDGAGGMILHPRSDSTPQMRMDVERVAVVQVAFFDFLVSETRPGEVRDEAEVKALIGEIDAARRAGV